MGGTPGKLLFSDTLSVLKLFKLPISGGKERRSFPVEKTNTISGELIITHSSLGMTNGEDKCDWKKIKP